MYTEYSFDGKLYQFHTESAIAMGKEKFLETYKGKIPNAEMIWNSIQPSEKPKAEKAPNKKVEAAPETK